MNQVLDTSLDKIPRDLLQSLSRKEPLPVAKIRELAHAIDSSVGPADELLPKLARASGVPLLKLGALVTIPKLLDEYDARNTGTSTMPLRDLLAMEERVKPLFSDAGSSLLANHSRFKVARATELYRQILSTAFKQALSEDKQILQAEKQLAVNSKLGPLLQALQSSTLPLHSSNPAAATGAPYRFSLTDVLNIARQTKQIYPKPRVVTILSGTSQILDMLQDLAVASKTPNDPEQKLKAASITQSLQAIASLVPIAATQLDTFEPRQFAKQIQDISAWEQGRAILATMVDISDGISEQRWSQQSQIPPGFAKIIVDSWDDLCLKGAAPSMSRTTPYRPDDYQQRMSDQAKQQIEARLKGTIGEVEAQRALLKLGYTILAVSLADLGSEPLFSGDSSSLRSQKTGREIDVVALSPGNPRAFVLVEVKSSSEGVLKKSFDCDIPDEQILARTTELPQSSQLVALGTIIHKVATFFRIPSGTPFRIMHLVTGEKDPLEPIKSKYQALINSYLPKIPGVFDSTINSRVGNGVRIEYVLKNLEANDTLHDHPLVSSEPRKR